MKLSEVTPWGIASFDAEYFGLPKNKFNLLRACDKGTELSAIGHFLEMGLAADERVVLVGFENPSSLFAGFNYYGFSFEDALKDERLVYLYYKQSFSHALSFTVDYRGIFDEILHIAGDGVHRIALMQADSLFNLQSYLLARSSAERIVAAGAGIDACILATCQRDIGSMQVHFDNVASAVLESYLEIIPLNAGGEWGYKLVWRRYPFPKVNGNLRLFLSRDEGLNSHHIGNHAYG